MRVLLEVNCTSITLAKKKKNPNGISEANGTQINKDSNIKKQKQTMELSELWENSQHSSLSGIAVPGGLRQEKNSWRKNDQNVSVFGETNKPTNPRSLTNSNQEKHKENYIIVHLYQIAKSQIKRKPQLQRKKKKRLIPHKEKKNKNTVTPDFSSETMQARRQ